MTYIITLSLLILAIIIIRAIFRRSASPLLIYGLWICVVLKLCLPFSLYDVYLPEFGSPSENEIDESVMESERQNGEQVGGSHTGDQFFEIEKGGEQTAGEIVFPEVTSPIETQPIYDVIDSEAGNDPQPSFPISPVDTENFEPIVNPSVTNEIVDGEKTQPSLNIKNVLCGIWIFGSAVLGTLFIISYAIFGVRAAEGRILIGKYKNLKVYSSEKVGTPCLHGIIPAIYLTPKAVKSEGKELILKHEYTHYRHGDHIWAMVRIIALVALWWNPLVLGAVLLSKQDGELACDHAVTQGLDEKGRIGYARVIIDMLPVRRSFATGFANSAVKERVIMMTKKRGKKLFSSLLCVLLTILAVGCSFFDRADALRYDANSLFESCFEDFRGSLVHCVYDGENVIGGYLHEADGDKISDIAELMLASKSKQVESVPYEKLNAPIYGMRFHNNNTGKDTSFLWTSGYLFAEDGSFYETDIELSGVMDVISEKGEGELNSSFPGIRMLAIQKGKWNKEYLAEDNSFDPTTVPEGISTEMISFFGEKLKVKLINKSQTTWYFGEEYGISVLLDDKWYYVPEDPRVWIQPLYMVDRLVGEYEKTHYIPLDLPSGRYRVTTMDTVFEFDIDYAERQKQIEADELGENTAFSEAVNNGLIAFFDEAYASLEPGGDFAAAEHILLGVVKNGEELTAYIVGSYGEWRLDMRNSVVDVTSVYAVTLRSEGDGYSYVSAFEVNKKNVSTIPEGLREIMISGYKEYTQDVHGRLRVKAAKHYALSIDDIIAELIDYIVSGAESLNINDPLRNVRDSDEYKELLEYGDYTVKYIYKYFMVYSNPAGLKPELMLMLTEDITGIGRGIDFVTHSQYFYDLFNTARELYNGDDELLKNQNYYLYLYIEAARERFDPVSFAGHIPNEGATVKLWHKLFANEIYLYFCVGTNDPKKLYIYYTDDFGDTIGTIDFEMPADMKYDSLMPVYAGNGAGSGECEFILRLKDGAREFYVSFDNFDYSDGDDLLVFNCRGVLDEYSTARIFGDADLAAPTRTSTLIKSIILEGGALDGVEKTIELDYYFELGKYFISKSERALITDDAEYEWEIVQTNGSHVLLYLGDGETHYYKGINVLNGETVNYFGSVSGEIIADSESVNGSSTGRFAIIQTKDKVYIDNSIWGMYYDVYELSGLEGANFARFVDEDHLFIGVMDKESGRIISGGVCDYMKFFDSHKKNFKSMIEDGKFTHRGITTEGMRFFEKESRYATVYNENKFYIVDLITGLISEADHNYSFYNDTVIPIDEGKLLAVSERGDGYALILASNGAVVSRVEINVGEGEQAVTGVKGSDGYYALIETQGKRHLYYVGEFES